MSSFRLNDPNGRRSTVQGQVDIYNYTSNERRALPVIGQDLYERWGRPVSIQDFGVDNSGMPIPEGQRVTARPDWLVTVGDVQRPVEAMVHFDFSLRDGHQMTTNSIKRHKILACLRYNASVFVIRNNYYLIYRPKTLGWILNNWQMRTFGGMGDNVCAVLQASDVERMICQGMVERRFYTPGARAAWQTVLREKRQPNA